MVNKVVVLTGPRGTYGYCTVPPLNDSAPERNIFRLSEFNFGNELELHVISACSQSQLVQLEQLKFIGNYHWISFPNWALPIASLLYQSRISNVISDRILGTSDPFSGLYLNLVANKIGEISPDIILINSFPQYIPFLRNRFPKIKLGLFARGEIGSSRKYLSQLDLIITNSSGIADYVRSLLNRALVPIHVIPNTLENSYCAQAKPYSNFLGKQIIYTGRIEPAKGVLELIQAFALVQEKNPDAQLVIVGGTFGQKKLTEFEEKLFIYAKDRSLAVMFIGQVPNSKLPEFYQKADLAVFPSICLESFGMVALEAMRCGLPVIASRRPGFEELIVPGETGLIVDDPRDIQSLADAMLVILKNPELARSMGQKGYLRSLNYVPSVAAQRFSEIIQAHV